MIKLLNNQWTTCAISDTNSWVSDEHASQKRIVWIHGQHILHDFTMKHSSIHLHTLYGIIYIYMNIHTPTVTWPKIRDWHVVTKKSDKQKRIAVPLKGNKNYNTIFTDPISFLLLKHFSISDTIHYGLTAKHNRLPLGKADHVPPKKPTST